MTLEEMEVTLPNGFHDSEIRPTLVDCVQRTATLELSVVVGDLNAPPERREVYKEATLVVSGVLVSVLEPPRPDYPFSEARGLRVDSCGAWRSLAAHAVESIARALDVPTTLTELPDGIDREAERLRLEDALEAAGLTWQLRQD